MTERRQINVKITPDKAEEWEEFVDDSYEIGSMTQLVRASVKYFIDHHDEDDGADFDKQFFIKQFEELQNKLETVENTAKATKHDQLTHEEVKALTLDFDEIQNATVQGVEEFFEAEDTDIGPRSQPTRDPRDQN